MQSVRETSLEVKLGYDALNSKIMKNSDIQFSQGDNNLGAGGFGIVRKAEFNGKLVAVKSFKVESEMNHFKAMELFIAEAGKMSQISHPRVIQFLGFVLESFSIVMEFMSEGTLADYLKANKGTAIPWSVRYWFAADIAEGMAYLHCKKTADGKPKIELFHQDLKHANVLLSIEDGRLRGKISDLGLAANKYNSTKKDESSKHNASAVTSFAVMQGGTYAYMAPELLRGSTKVKPQS